jgi:hypothetical protein
VSQASKQPWLVIAISTALIFIVGAVIFFAFFAPPTPERVVAQFIDGLISQDFEKLAQVSTAPARNQLSAVASNRDAEAKWYDWWTNSSQYFNKYRFGETVVDGETATVTVLYGPGQFLVMEVHLARSSRGWRVRDAK